MPSFSSSSFNAVTIATATDVALADEAKAPAKNSSKDEAADGTAGADRLFDRWRTEEVE